MTLKLNDAEVKMIAEGSGFKEEDYRELFNSFVLKPIGLSIDSPKALAEMTDEELTAWTNNLESFIRTVKIAGNASRITLEDRKLKLSEKQRFDLEKLDKAYQPKPRPKREKEVKEAKDKWIPSTAEEKRVALTMKLLGLSQEEAEAWIATQIKDK